MKVPELTNKHVTRTDLKKDLQQAVNSNIMVTICVATIAEAIIGV